MAGLIGLTIGVEREWSGHASGPSARFAGARTFFLLGLVGGISGLLVAQDRILLAVVLLAGSACLAVAAYVVASQETGDRDGTTEAAALLVLGTGTLAGSGYQALAAGVAAVAVLALAERAESASSSPGSARPSSARRCTSPSSPSSSSHCFRRGIRPRRRDPAPRAVDPGPDLLGRQFHRLPGTPSRWRGAGLRHRRLLGGLVSSTAVTLSFSRQSRVTPEHARGLALGVIGACTVLLPRVLTVTLLLSPPVARHLLAYLIAPAIVGGCVLIYVLLREEPAPAGGTAPDPGNPLRLGTALQMALAFQVVLLVVPAAERLGGRAVCWAPRPCWG